MTRIMAIAAHPGDAFFSMGAVVAQHIHSGGNGVFLNLSSGERGHPSISEQDYGAMQREAAGKAAEMLGAQTVFLNYRDAEIPRTEQATFAVCDAIREHRPDIIITHWRGSWHKDHRNTFHIAADATFYAALPSLERDRPSHETRRTYFAENWEDATDYHPDILLNVTPVFERWMQACALFPMWRGETGLIRYCDYYRSLAVMRGCLAGVEYAAGLMSDPNQRIRRVQSLDEIALDLEEKQSGR